MRSDQSIPPGLRLQTNQKPKKSVPTHSSKRNIRRRGSTSTANARPKVEDRRPARTIKKFFKRSQELVSFTKNPRLQHKGLQAGTPKKVSITGPSDDGALVGANDIAGRP